MAPNQKNKGMENARFSEDVLAKEKKPHEYIKDIDKANDVLSKNLTKINSAVQEYNKKYHTKPWFRDAFGYEQELIAFEDNPEESIKQIDRILAGKHKDDGTGLLYKLSEKAPSKKRELQASELSKIKNLFLERVKLIEKVKIAKEEDLKGRMRGLVIKNRELQSMKKTSLEWENKKEYKTLENEYNDVIGKFIKDRRYEKLYKNLSETEARQSKQLFFAILAKETNGFSTDFPLGENFTENSAENIKNFPFIYYEWLTKTKGFDPEKIEEKKNELNAKENEMKAKGIFFGEEIVTKFNKWVTQTPYLQQYTNIINSPFEGLDKKNSREYSEKRLKALDEMKSELTKIYKAIDKSDPNGKKIANEISNTYIEKHIGSNEKYENLKLGLKSIEEKKEHYDKNFVRSEFSKKSNLQMVMELAMLKFQKAAEVTDKLYPAGGSIEPNINPNVRRHLISTIYLTGVVRRNPKDITGKYMDVKGDEHNWMKSKLITSPEFNRSLKEKYLSPEKVSFIVAAHYANMAVFSIDHLKKFIIPELEKMKPIFDRVTKNIEDKKALPENDPKRTAIQEQIKNDLKEIHKWTTIEVDENNVGRILELEKGHLKSWEEFFRKTEALFANPTEENIKKFIKKEIIEAKDQNLYKLSSEKIFKKLANDLIGISINYRTLDTKEMRADDYLEKMGVVPETMFKAYQEYLIKLGPEMKVDQWNNLLMSKGGTTKLLEMFNTILPPSSIFRGREDFLRVFETLHGVNPLETNPPLTEAQATAISIYTMLKEEMEKREGMSGLQGRAYDEALEKLNGSTFGEKITDYAKGVIDMVMGPGQTIANRAAGAAILFMVWKMGKAAWKGEGALGKVARIAFLAGATELTVKHLTGEGLLDKLKLGGISQALSGTYEDVLLHRAGDLEYFKASSAEHAAALMELRDVPFLDIMAWYEATDANGQPIDKKNTKAKVPRQIDIYNILPGKIGENKEREARVILKKTIENFFGYVGNKQNKDASWGHGVLKNVWIDSIRDENYAMKSAEFANRGMPDFLIKRFRGNPKEVTWQTVMQAEITISDVEALKKKSLMNQVKDYLIDKTGSLARWGDREILHKVGVGAESFWNNVTDDYVPKIQKFLGDMGKAGAVNLRYYSDKVELWYEENKITIRKIADQHWEIVKDGVKLPFQILYGLDQWIVPWAGMKLKQFKEIFNPELIVYLDGDLQATDIVPDDLTKLPMMENRIGSMYMPAFSRAFGKKASAERMFYETVGQDETLPNYDNLSGGIAYYISETTQEISDPIAGELAIKTGVNKTDDYADRFGKMQKAAGKDAVRVFKNKYPQMSEKEIEEYMYPIHVYATKPAPNQQPPQKIYTFWRMPTPQSDEYQTKKAKRWTDYLNPNEYKNRPPFLIKPERSLWYNITLATGLRNPTLRTATDKVTASTIAQILRFYASLAENLGNAGAFVTEKIGRMKTGEADWLRELATMDEQTKQKIDEWLGSAGNPSLALSQFYKNKNNAAVYQAAFEKSVASKEELRKLNLGGIPEKKGNLTGWVKVAPLIYKNGKYVKGTPGSRINTDDFEGDSMNPSELDKYIRRINP